MLKLAISACLAGDPVRYDGSDKFAPDILGTPDVEWLKFCPESEIGLGVPRPTIGIDPHRGELRLRENLSRRDHTETMRTYAGRRIRELLASGVRGFVVKSKSPSCGLSDTPHGPGAAEFGSGLFTALLREHFPAVPVIDENGWRDPANRRDFFRSAVEFH